MQRVSIIGCPGSGKSTFARKLHRITDLPLIHLDREFWQADWKEPNKAEFRQHIREVYERDSWIIDGHYRSTLEDRLGRSDVVFHLDYPVSICLWRAIGRTLRNYGKDSLDRTVGCPERFSFKFLCYILSFRNNFRGEIMGFLEKYSHLEVHSFAHPRELEEYLALNENSAG